MAFSTGDSRSIEIAFQKLAETESNTNSQESTSIDLGNLALREADNSLDTRPKPNTSINDSTSTEKGGLVKVPVNEDFLFDVDVEERELAPAYWLGPIYDVRRGSWFYQEGSTLRPCDENLASQLEEGYIKLKPWRYESNQTQAPASQPKPRPKSVAPAPNVSNTGELKGLKDIKTRSSENLVAKSAADSNFSEKFSLQTQRLFGTYMNSVVTYQDATVAWLLTDDFLSRMSSTVYQRFAGGGHLGGVKVVRGFSEGIRAKEKKKEGGENSGAATLGGDTTATNVRRKFAPPSVDQGHATGSTHQRQDSKPEIKIETEAQSEPRILKLERQMSSLVSSPGPEDPAKQDEEVRKRDEDEIQEDYKGADGDDQGREIEHLILVTHGIGQRLGLRMESVNFIHDVNVLRKTLKTVYESSPDLQALNSEVDKLPKNCRIQVLPVVWRHLLDFPKQSFQDNRREQDLTDTNSAGDEEVYPSLDDITVEGVPAVRNLITDLALDILLYQSAYREHIAGIVQRECNRVYDLFLQRNPSFKGKVSLVGHSLGSAILFDILCRQKDTGRVLPSSNLHRRQRSYVDSKCKPDRTQDLGLVFDVEDFYCLGSPLGLYQMLKGRRIAGRDNLHRKPAESPLDPGSMDDPFLGASLEQSATTAKQPEILSITLSSPKCQQLFNIFHNADCIAYRLEPLISPSMSALKPQPLPYTKKGYFGAPGQGFTGIGARVGQSVSGFWSNITSGVANSLLNRSLGLTGEGQFSSPSQSMAPLPVGIRPPSSAGAGTNIVAAGVISASTVKDNKERKQDLKEGTVDNEQTSEHPSTRIDAEIETLYAGFEKQRKNLQRGSEGRDLCDSSGRQEVNDRARRLKREEDKVRALNANGRVDYVIQE